MHMSRASSNSRTLKQPKIFLKDYDGLCTKSATNIKRGVFTFTEPSIIEHSMPETSRASAISFSKVSAPKISSVTSIDEMLAHKPTKPLLKRKDTIVSTMDSISSKKHPKIPLIDSAIISTKAILDSILSSPRTARGISLTDHDLLDREHTPSGIYYLTEKCHTEEATISHPILKPPARSLGEIRRDSKQILCKGRVLNKGLKKMEKKRDMVEETYLKSLEDLKEKADNPAQKFNYWRTNKLFLEQKEKVREEVEKFRAEFKESIKEKEELRKLDQYRVIHDWDGSDTEDPRLTKVERLLLKKARPFRIRAISREAKIEARSKAFDLEKKFDTNHGTDVERTGQKDNILTEATNKQMAATNIIGKYFSDKTLTKYLSKQEQKDSKENLGDIQIPYNSDNDDGDLIKKTVYKKPFRHCQPKLLEVKASAQDYKNDYTVFRKMSLYKRSQKENL